MLAAMQNIWKHVKLKTCQKQQNTDRTFEEMSNSPQSFWAFIKTHWCSMMIMVAAALKWWWSAMVMSTGSYTYMIKLDSFKQLSVKCVDKWYLCSGNISVFYMPGALSHSIATQYKYNRNQFSNRRPALWCKIKLYEACKHNGPVPILSIVSTDAHSDDAPFSAARIHARQNEFTMDADDTDSHWCCWLTSMWFDFLHDSLRAFSLTTALRKR